MPKTVVNQIHCLAKCAKNRNKLTFTNFQSQYLDDLYANITGIDSGNNEEDESSGVWDSNDDDDSNFNTDNGNQSLMKKVKMMMTQVYTDLKSQEWMMISQELTMRES